MAVSKNTRRSDPDTNELFQSFFQNSQVSEERKHAWYDAVRHAGTGPPPLRFRLWCKYLRRVDEALEKDALMQQALRSRS